MTITAITTTKDANIMVFVCMCPLVAALLTSVW